MKKNKNFIILFFIFSIFLDSPSYSNEVKKLNSEINAEIKSPEKTINFKNLKNINWNVLEIYAPYSRKDKLEKKYNIKLDSENFFYGSLKEHLSLLIFLNNGKVEGLAFFPRKEFDFSVYAKKGLIKKENALFIK